MSYLSRFTVSVSWRNPLLFIYVNAYRHPAPPPRPCQSPGSAGNKNSALRTSWVLRVQPDSSHPPTQQSRTLNSAPFTGGVAGAGRAPAGSSRTLSLEAGSSQDRGGTSGPSESTGDSLRGAGQAMHLLWAPRWVSRKVDALLEWPGCPGGGDVAHRKPGCRPPLAPPQTCRLLRLWPPLPQTRTRLLATHPSSIRAVCPCPHTLCVCSSPERIRASKSRAEGLGGSSGTSLSPPSLHTQSAVCISGLCPPSAPSCLDSHVLRNVPGL